MQTLSVIVILCPLVDSQLWLSRGPFLSSYLRVLDICLPRYECRWLLSGLAACMYFTSSISLDIAYGTYYGFGFARYKDVIIVVVAF